MKKEQIVDPQVDGIATTLGAYAFVISGRSALSKIIETPTLRRNLIKFIEASIELSKGGLKKSYYKSVDQLGVDKELSIIEALKAVNNPRVRKQVKQALKRSI